MLGRCPFVGRNRGAEPPTLFTLAELTEAAKGLPSGKADNQYGFRQGRGTIQAFEEVLSLADTAASGPTQDRDLLLLVTLDVKNAFNTALGAAIDEAVRQKGAPEYMISMMNRAVLFDDGVTQREIEVLCGVPQGSVLRPAL